MVRLVEASRALREAVPPELVPLFWLITLLGSAKFLIVVLSLAYWNWVDRREEMLALVAVAFVALTVTLTLKYGFDLSRPPPAVRRYPVETSPVGFPSGHAIAATVIYGGGLVALEKHRERGPLLATGALVVAIGLSRVVLGVHYLGDVLAGFAVGLVVVGVVRVVLDRGPEYGFGAAVVLSVPTLVVTGGNADAAFAAGGSVGCLLATLAATGESTFESRGQRVAANAVGVAFAVALVAVAELGEMPLPAAAGTHIALAFGIVALPAAVARYAGVDR